LYSTNNKSSIYFLAIHAPWCIIVVELTTLYIIAKGEAKMVKFGALVKDRRLKKQIGLRVFASSIGEDAGNWCRVESGRLPAPSDIKILNKICTVLEIKDTEKEHFFDLAAKDSKEKVPADIKHQIEENDIIPILFRTIDKKKLSRENLKKLVKRIQDEY
jgi:transcriptional regulator with XRE-family HTH domain